jgi:hypothetical protein
MSLGKELMRKLRLRCRKLPSYSTEKYWLLSEIEEYSGRMLAVEDIKSDSELIKIYSDANTLIIYAPWQIDKVVYSSFTLTTANI